MKFKEKLMLKIFESMLKKSYKDLPAPKYLPGMQQDYDVKTRDGITLVTHIYFPDKPGNYPVILVRSPYVHGFDLQKLIFTEYIKFGFILCYQECRGRGESEGEWEPFIHEGNDTEDTIKWLSKQRFCKKGIALLGSSYLSMVHLAASDVWGDAVKTAFLPVFGNSVYDVMYNNGIYKEEFSVIWCFQNNSIENLSGEKQNEYYLKSKSVTPKGNIPQALFGGDIPFFSATSRQPDRAAAFWRAYDLPDGSGIKVPVCLLGGWYDFAVKGQLDLLSRLKGEAKDRSRLIIGPWNHAMLNKGDIKTPGHDITGMIGLTIGLEWFLHIFYGLPLKEDFNLKYYEISGAGYKTGRGLPDTVNKGFIFSGTAAGNGFYLLSEHGDGKPLSFEFDPSNPSPTCGGGGLTPLLIPVSGAPKQYNALQPKELRPDTLYFETAPFAADAAFCGQVKVRLCVSSDCEDTAFYVKLCLKKGSKRYHIADGITSLSNAAGKYAPDERVNIEFSLNPAAFMVKKGWALSVNVTGSDAPAYAVHNNTTVPWADATEYKTAKNTLYTDGCSITLPEVK